MALVQIKNLTKRYHKGDETITPLENVSLDIEESEFVSLMGASGYRKIDTAEPGGNHRSARQRPHHHRRYRRHDNVADEIGTLASCPHGLYLSEPQFDPRADRI